VRHRLEYWAVLTVRAGLRLLPHAVVRGLGAGLGLTFYALDRKHRAVALDNLARCFPSRNADERRATARAMFAHFGRLLFELLKFSTLSHAAMMRRVEFEGEDRARHAYAQGKGVLFFTGHFGFWELHALVHGLQLEPIGVLARALDNPYLNTLLDQVRTRTGNTVIYRQGAVRRVMKTLAAGHGVAMLIDQHMHSPDAVRVDFFERPAATTSTLAALALRTGAPVVPVFAVPVAGGRYRMIYEAPVDPPSGTGPDAIRESDLWLWMHRRWRE
jgi:KDO2-lipid IV(A) lauroyltransferase